jgi:hypothetical protein
LSFLIKRFEMDAVALAHCLLSRKGLPPTDCEVDKEGIDLDRQANPRTRLSSDEGRAASKKWFLDRLAGTGIVQHRTSHAFDRLLGCMLGFSVLAAGRDIPKSGLLAVAGPITSLSYGIPAWLVLPVVVASAHYETLLGPDNL